MRKQDCKTDECTWTKTKTQRDRERWRGRCRDDREGWEDRQDRGVERKRVRERVPKQRKDGRGWRGCSDGWRNRERESRGNIS